MFYLNIFYKQNLHVIIIDTDFQMATDTAQRKINAAMDTSNPRPPSEP